MIFLQKATIQYTIFKTVLLYLLKFIRLNEHQQETKVPFFLLFSALFSRESSEIDLKDEKTLFFSVPCNISTSNTGSNFL